MIIVTTWHFVNKCSDHFIVYFLRFGKPIVLSIKCINLKRKVTLVHYVGRAFCPKHAFFLAILLRKSWDYRQKSNVRRLSKAVNVRSVSKLRLPIAWAMMHSWRGYQTYQSQRRLFFSPVGDQSSSTTQTIVTMALSNGNEVTCLSESF